MVFEPFWSEIGYVLCTLAWNLVLFLGETIFFFLLTSEEFEDLLKVYANGTDSWIPEVVY